MAGVVWSVRKGQFDGPEIVGDYRSSSRVREPRLGDVLQLPDGLGPWRVVDWTLADRIDSTGNVLVVESAVGRAA